ncbi:ArgE/DapE family deacylase [Enterococcus sp. AZ163]|uniref:ArgE/DapE family deacylase n=1 Tax=Enterococcus sp. AZ163 TaxID=2774638 RepID=UPI003D2B5BD2
MMNNEEKVKILADLVAIQSVNDHEVTVAEYLIDLFKAHSIEAKMIKLTDTRANLVAEIGQGAPVIGVSGHMDVVSAGDKSNWASDPFQLTERDGNLYGRGSADMKSGLAALVIAMIEIHEQKLLKKGTIRLMATTGEEVGGQGAYHFYKDGFMKDVDALVIAEPSQDTIIYSHKGSMDARIQSKGKAAHSSMPQLGYNAIDPLIEFVHEANNFFRTTDRTNAIMGDLVMNTTIFQGGNQVNSIPEEAVLEMNIRTIPEFDNDEVAKDLEKLVADQNKTGAKLTLDIYMSLPSVLAAKESKLSALAAKLGQEHLNQEIQTAASPGVTDASNFLRDKSANFPFIMFGPGETKMAHQVDEYVNKDVYLKFIDLYVDLLTGYVGE